MTYIEYANLIRRRTNTDSTTLPDSDIVLFTNAYLPTLSTRINETASKLLGVTAYQDLVADQREYPFPEDKYGSVLQIEAKLASNYTDWVRLIPVDIELLDIPLDEDSITTYFSNAQGSAKYADFRDSFFIYSGELDDVTDGIRMFYQGRIEPIASSHLSLNQEMNLPISSSENWKHGIPVEFQELMARYVQIQWKTAGDRNISLSENEMRWEEDMRERLEALKYKELNKDIGIKSDGILRHNSGWDY